MVNLMHSHKERFETNDPPRRGSPTTNAVPTMADINVRYLRTPLKPAARQRTGSKNTNHANTEAKLARPVNTTHIAETEKKRQHQ